MNRQISELFSSYSMELLVLQVVQVDKKQSILHEIICFTMVSATFGAILHEIVGFTTILLNKIPDNASNWNPPRCWKSEVGGLGSAETIENVD